MTYSIIHFASLGFVGEVQADSKSEAYSHVAEIYGLTKNRAMEKYIVEAAR